MSKRLQVVLDEQEMADIQTAARVNRLTVAEWVRQALRRERREQPTVDAERKIRCVREATTCSYPTGDIADLLQEIERGRSGTGAA